MDPNNKKNLVIAAGGRKGWLFSFLLKLYHIGPSVIHITVSFLDGSSMET